MKIRNKIAAVATALALGLGGAVAVAAPASAHTGDLNVSYTCDTTTGEYVGTAELTISQTGLDGVTNWKVGTTNFDSRSFAHNEENNVCVCDAAFSRELNAMFARDAAVCDRVSLQAWRNRPLFDKVLQGLSSFVQDQV